MHHGFTRPGRWLALAFLVAAFLAPNGARAQDTLPVALSELAALRADPAAGGEPRFFDRPVVLPPGRVIALKMPARTLVALETGATRPSVREIATPAGVYVPLALAADGAGRLLVLDPSTNRVLRFTLAGSTLRPAGSFAVDNGATDLCAMNGRLYVYRPAAARPVTVYSDAGVRVGGFGQQFGSGSARRRETMSAARLLCAASARTLVVASNLTGEIQSYAENGRLLWARRVAGITAVPVLDSGGGMTTMMSPPGGYHMLLSLTALGPGQILAQYGFQATGQPTGFRRVDSRRFASSTGAELGRQADLPGWLVSLGGDRAVSLDQSTGAATVWRVRARRGGRR